MPLELALSQLGLRDSFVQALKELNITECYPWQAAALREAVPAGSNFVYTAPTSGGKSLVADILMLRRLQDRISDWKKPRAKALVLVPYLSIGMMPTLKRDSDVHAMQGRK
jgi:replicative superfamily II helicase